jgi:hypothetical protein
MDEKEVRGDEREAIFDLVLPQHRRAMSELSDVEVLLYNPNPFTMQKLVALRKKLRCLEYRMRRLLDMINYGNSEYDWTTDVNQDC